MNHPEIEFYVNAVPKTRPPLKNVENGASCGLFTIQNVLDYTFTKAAPVVLPVTTNVPQIISYAFSVIS